MKHVTISVKVRKDIKNQAEDILDDLGVPTSVVINALYRQIIYQKRIPFSISLPSSQEENDDTFSASDQTPVEESGLFV